MNNHTLRVTINVHTFEPTAPSYASTGGRTKRPASHVSGQSNETNGKRQKCHGERSSSSSPIPPPHDNSGAPSNTSQYPDYRPHIHSLEDAVIRGVAMIIHGSSVHRLSVKEFVSIIKHKFENIKRVIRLNKNLTKAETAKIERRFQKLEFFSDEWDTATGDYEEVVYSAAAEIAKPLKESAYDVGHTLQYYREAVKADSRVFDGTDLNSKLKETLMDTSRVKGKWCDKKGPIQYPQEAPPFEGNAWFGEGHLPVHKGEPFYRRRMPTNPNAYDEDDTSTDLYSSESESDHESPPQRPDAMTLADLGIMESNPHHLEDKQMPEAAPTDALASSWATQSIKEKFTSPGIDSLSVPGSGSPINATCASSQDRYHRRDEGKTSDATDARPDSPESSKTRSRAPGSSLQPEIIPAVEVMQEKEPDLDRAAPPVASGCASIDTSISNTRYGLDPATASISTRSATDNGTRSPDIAEAQASSEHIATQNGIPPHLHDRSHEGWIKFKDQIGEIGYEEYLEFIRLPQARIWINYVAYASVADPPLSFAEYRQ